MQYYIVVGTNKDGGMTYYGNCPESALENTVKALVGIGYTNISICKK